MHVVEIREPGNPDVLIPAERPTPNPGGSEILVRVAAAGINRADLLQRRGLYPPPPGVDPDIPGLEYSGEVVSCGPRASLFQPGDQVMGLVPGAGYASYVCIPEATALPVPSNLTPEAAAAIPEAFLTAWRGLFDIGNLAPGETVLIRAASSGVGMAAIQLAAWAGARVIAGSRNAKRLAHLEQLGADLAFQDTGGALRTAAPGTIDMAIDFLGGELLQATLDTLRPGGRVVLIGLIAGRHATLNLGSFLTRRLGIRAFTMRSMQLGERAELTMRFRRQGLHAIAQDRLKPIIDQYFPWREAAQAHARMEAGEHFGKILLRFNDS